MAIMKVGAAGIETISGAMKRPKKQDGHNHGNYLVAVHRKAASDRYKRTTPLKPKEVAIRQRFQAVQAMVRARKEDLTKVTQDQIDFLAQKDLANGKKTMKAYLWKVCGQEYDESQD